ncbi:hypothetical protein BU26DRAFT_182597 [Trematosphaeria pertusa]|uniref:Uncharacterized protein n=1 Tax=Trematosphaeria pertusa TaxID=390896 RepID=A0A6A6HSM6_9PLEO|nr:uncharacterized protein BU26DRAFT_182597 [Trematosphaeria pertusa]KAF2241184.1 hypothetical protein BU26DRAFT_182597 [Trematosphaeria pertusa]
MVRRERTKRYFLTSAWLPVTSSSPFLALFCEPKWNTVHNMSSRMSKTYVKPMLSEERERLPPASEVKRVPLEKRSWKVLLACSCRGVAGNRRSNNT